MILKNHSFPFWNAVLMIAVVFMAFIFPVFPLELQRGVFRMTYSLICVAAIFTLGIRSWKALIFFFTMFIIEWVSALFSMSFLNIVAKAANILFFLIIVIRMIWVVAGAKKVTTEVILGSVIGYLLLGIIYSIFINIILLNDPAAFNIAVDKEMPGHESVNASIPMYFSFVTLATLGYGDFLPLKPYSRSLMTFIAISGQFYIAIIVALLVGKFSAQATSDLKEKS
jgi:hypothetical protein